MEKHNLETQTALQAAASKANNFDYELKKMKEMFAQQLTRAKEESTKLKRSLTEAENKVKKLKAAEMAGVVHNQDLGIVS